MIIEPVLNLRSRKDFIEFPYEHYRENQNWVPPLKLAVEEMLNEKKHPFFKHAKSKLFVCRSDEGKVLGRIGVFIDESHNEFHNEKAAFFGFFESVDDPKVAQELFKAAKVWAKSNAAEFLRGPFQLNSNYESGLLIKGFDDTPAVGMTYNWPYYSNLMEQAGFEKEKDLLAYYVAVPEDQGDQTPSVLRKHFERSLKKNNIRFRELDMSRFDEEIEKAFEVYNAAWEKNWGFVPVGHEEFKFLAKDMKMVMDPRLCYFVEVDGELAGFSLALPDVYKIQRKIRDGKLFPFGLIKLLWGLKTPGLPKRVKRIRVLILGVKKKFEHLGLGALMYTNYFIEGQKMGYYQSECSWVLEDNQAMTRALDRMGAEALKTYRVYRSPL